MFTFFDLFAGIGGFRLGLEALGGRCVGHAEIDSGAISIYKRNFRETPNFGDVSSLVELPRNLDFLVGGVPCQPWSKGGKNLGFQDARGRLWFHVFRLVQYNRPKYLLFENVKGLTEPRHENAFKEILSRLRREGYDVFWSLQNAKDFGLPQSRDRVFILGFRNDLNVRQFECPNIQISTLPLYCLLDGIEKSQGDCGGVDVFRFVDTRGGQSTIHSWDIDNAAPEVVAVCEFVLKNRRLRQYSDRDGSPLPYSLIMSYHRGEAIKAALSAQYLKDINGKIDIAKRRNNMGINGIQRIFMPHSKEIATIVAMANYLAIATRGFIGSRNSQQNRLEFLKKIYQPGHYRMLNTHDFLICQGFPKAFRLSNSPADNRCLGNAVPPVLVSEIAQAMLQATPIEATKIET